MNPPFFVFFSVRRFVIPLMAAIAMCGCGTVQDTTSVMENPVVRENRNEGTLAWLIDVPERRCPPPDHQWCRRPQIEGYCSK
ncbi:MAG TPA: hypothetical protein VFO54_04110, partial [Chryseosolibacter sp.]|nr:hypothetical protein [Chryseosolibacter sp.]